MRFLEIRYVSYIKDTNQIFDYSEKPVIVPVGKGLLYSFLEKALENVEPGKSYRFVFIKPFGERREDLIKIVPLSEFLRHNVKPFPGLIVNIDGRRGIVRSISGGRVIVDFNHPVAGKDLVYEIEVLREVTDLEEKIAGTLSFLLGIDKEKVKVSIEDKKVSVEIDGQKLPDQYKELLKKVIDELKDYELQ